MEPMEFSIEADDQPANSALDRVRAKLTSVERTAVEGFRRMTGAADGFARGVVKVAEATGAVEVRCEFCGREYHFPLTEFGILFHGAEGTVPAPERLQ